MDSHPGRKFIIVMGRSAFNPIQVWLPQPYLSHNTELHSTTSEKYKRGGHYYFLKVLFGRYTDNSDKQTDSRKGPTMSEAKMHEETWGKISNLVGNILGYRWYSFCNTRMCILLKERYYLQMYTYVQNIKDANQLKPKNRQYNRQIWLEGNTCLLCCNAIFKCSIQAFFCYCSNYKVWKLIFYPAHWRIKINPLIN